MKNELRFRLTGIIALASIILICIFAPSDSRYYSGQGQLQQELNKSVIPLTRSSVVEGNELDPSYYLEKWQASVNTVNGMPTPAPTKPYFRGWVQEKFYSENKQVLAQYRAGSLDELINVLNNQRRQQIAHR